ncbi:DUF1178 family protein [Novosphingobium panipatense]|uniref:DUF1178 family protein n=1 Tax=Novosphingobium panipatense TaxID=428991 RepID=A0ABY1QMJ6_9SPHN|nr:DUF1178 family protein [Novosphingobium panipatense]SMP74210.1 hypothetical protein SAMN06296065_1078 [Novosphingobium panipatense]
MIVYDLECRAAQHRFEGWFKSSGDYARQQKQGFVACPHCGSTNVAKAVQAPRLARKGNQLPERAGVSAAKAAPSPPLAKPTARDALPPQAVELLQTLATMQAEALKSSRYVGDKFVDEARAMHYGEQDAEAIHGQATAADARELLEEGVGLVPLPFPIVTPEKAN